MKPVLTVFFDALKPASLEHMPFLNSFPVRRRLRTLLGYSITCHASMYSGVYPNKHLMWFVWMYAPATSPFGWTRLLGSARAIDTIPARLLLNRATRLFTRRTSLWGIPPIVHLPIRYWRSFDVSERKFWDEPGYLAPYPTIFELLREADIPYESPGLANIRGDSSELVARHEFSEIKPWTYLFIGDVDKLSHLYVQESPEAIARLKALDRLVERKYREYERRQKDFHFFVFSDHGHHRVASKVDFYDVFRRHGEDLNAYVHVLDGNFARFWFRHAGERERVERLLARLEGGFVLTEQMLRRYHVDMPDNRYGDLIYYLDRPHVFSKTIFGFGRSINSMHGYVPDHADSDGLFVSNLPVAGEQAPELVDILPSTLSLLGVPIPAHVEGRVLWRDGPGAPAPCEPLLEAAHG